MGHYLHPEKHFALQALHKNQKKGATYSVKKKPKKSRRKKVPDKFDAQKYVAQHAYELGLRSGRG